MLDVWLKAMPHYGLTSVSQTVHEVSRQDLAESSRFSLDFRPDSKGIRHMGDRTRDDTNVGTMCRCEPGAAGQCSAIAAAARENTCVNDVNDVTRGLPDDNSDVL